LYGDLRPEQETKCDADHEQHHRVKDDVPWRAERGSSVPGDEEVRSNELERQELAPPTRGDHQAPSPNGRSNFKDRLMKKCAVSTPHP
jgi:hypothetical protein